MKKCLSAIIDGIFDPYFFILTMGRGSIYSELYKNTQGAFNEYGVQIMSLPCRVDPARPRIVPKERIRVARETNRRPGEVEERSSTRVSYYEGKAWKEGV